jgi:glycosyltransferase involved in cell wall biosynthesis
MCVIVTIDLTILNLCRGRLEYFIEHGFDVTVVCAPTPLAAAIEARSVRLHTAPLTRKISPLRDLLALWNLYRFLRREQFDLVEVSTPKGALIGSLAARLSGVPCLVHLLRGLAYQGKTGLGARLLRFAHAIPCRIADRVISISTQTMEQACRDDVCDRDKIEVLGYGSSNGVDLKRFSPLPEEVRRTERAALGVTDNDVVAGFVGRLTRDKGIVELVDTFAALHETMPKLRLLVVGDYEKRDRPPQRVINEITENTRIKHVEWQHETWRFFGAMDFLVLPTHREGFGTVLLEAGAMGLPVVTTEAAGWWGAVDQAKEALCVPVGDSDKLREAIARLAGDAALRCRMGNALREKVTTHYDCRRVWSLQEQAFRRLLNR